MLTDPLKDPTATCLPSYVTKSHSASTKEQHYLTHDETNTTRTISNTEAIQSDNRSPTSTSRAVGQVERGYSRPARDLSASLFANSPANRHLSAVIVFRVRLAHKGHPSVASRAVDKAGAQRRIVAHCVAITAHKAANAAVPAHTGADCPTETRNVNAI